jgi:hypothetical protein
VARCELSALSPSSELGVSNAVVGAGLSVFEISYIGSSHAFMPQLHILRWGKRPHHFIALKLMSH